jgi:beta-glucuronidase
MKQLRYLMLLLCFFAPLAAAQNAPASQNAAATPDAPSSLLANFAGRTSTSLNGAWNVIVDPFESGLGQRYYENRKPQNKSDLVEYDFDASPTLQVPGDWNTQRPDLFFYEGPVWYKKSFSYHKKPNTRVFVYFAAANSFTRVYLNGKPLGEHQGGFTPFNFEITSQLADGDNFLIAEVNNTRHADGLPALNSDWWNYGGLTRDVALIELPEIFIQNYSVQLAKGSPNEIAGWVQLNGAESSQEAQRVNIEIPEAAIRQSVTVDRAGRATFHFPAKLQLWSPDSPKLYRVTLSTASSSLSDDIGFRTIETRGSQILLNGKPIFLRGITMHDEAPIRGGRTFGEDDDRMLLGWAKELGCNFVRLAHYTHNEAAVRLADKMGLLLWAEVPVYWGIAWENPATLENAKAQMRDMIARDQNRASIILWSLSNETPQSPERLAFLSSLATFTRQLDNTRLITSALNTAKKTAPDTETLDDPLGDVVDVLGLNQYLGWYNGKAEDADNIKWIIAQKKPLIASEFGGGAVFGRHADTQTRWSEEFQANIYEHQIKMLRRIPELAGMSPWVLMDFHSPRRLLPGVQDDYNRKGLVSNKGEKKQAFYVLQKYYQENAAATAAATK